jgi:hypothetical protein
MFAMLETTDDGTEELLDKANLENFGGRSFLLRRVSASKPSTGKNNLGNAKFNILFDGNSTITELFGNPVKNSFLRYAPLMKIFLKDNERVKKVKRLDMPKKPTTV